MGVYIANIQKPNDCIYCNMYNGEWYDEELGIEFDCMVKNDQADDCPLIEIDLVRCGECKHWYRNKPPIDEECDMLPNADDFCPYGERRTE